MRQSTWNNLGTEFVTSNKNYRELLMESDLDYDVVAKDLFVEHEGTQLLVPNRKVILREDNSEIFGIVSDRYQICQNRDALDFVQYLDDVVLERAGSSGSMVWMLGRLPEVNVLGDTINPYLIFQNSHDGSCSIKTTICMLRFVCQNQFVASFKDSPATISIRHQGNLDEKLLVAKDTMAGVYDYVKNYDLVANSLATQKITPATFNKIVEQFFAIPEDASTRVENSILERRENFIRAYEVDDNQNFKGTKWGVVNAYSDFTTHEEFARKVNGWETNRFLYSLNPNNMTQFMRVVEAA